MQASLLCALLLPPLVLSCSRLLLFVGRQRCMFLTIEEACPCSNRVSDLDRREECPLAHYPWSQLRPQLYVMYAIIVHCSSSCPTGMAIHGHTQGPAQAFGWSWLSTVQSLMQSVLDTVSADIFRNDAAASIGSKHWPTKHGLFLLHMFGPI